MQSDHALLVTVFDRWTNTDPSNPEREFLCVAPRQRLTVTKLDDNVWTATGYIPEAARYRLQGELLQPRWWLVSPLKRRDLGLQLYYVDNWEAI